MTPDRISQAAQTMTVALEPLSPGNKEVLGLFATVTAALVLDARDEGEPPVEMLDRLLTAVRASVLPHLPLDVLH
jgi:hypothetical protein